jgi:hypothetical protein
MNAPERARAAKVSFQWDDPLLLEQQLSAVLGCQSLAAEHQRV